MAGTSTSPTTNDATLKFSIPPKLNTSLRPVPSSSLDPRTDAEIVASLKSFQPITSERNVWAYWHAGFDAMPGWCKRNVLSWVRICGAQWTIRVLDTVPNSPNNALKYLSESLLPETFVRGTMQGIYTGPHSADFLRGACLYSYGGVYMDVGNILIRSLDRICWNRLEQTDGKYKVAVPLMYGRTIANHFVASRRGDPFIERWHKLFITLWKGRQSHEGIIDNPLVAFGKTRTFDESRESKMDWDFCVSAETVMNYIAQVIAWERLCMLKPHPQFDGDAFDCSEYWAEHVLCFDVLQEDWAAESVVGFKNGGERIFNLLQVRLDVDKESEEYKAASELVWRLLAGSSLQKVVHGKGLTNDESLGKLLDKPENDGKDCVPGSFGELLRYGAVHFEQTRPEIRWVPSTPVKPEFLMEKGVLEP